MLVVVIVRMKIGEDDERDDEVGAVKVEALTMMLTMVMLVKVIGKRLMMR